MLTVRTLLLDEVFVGNEVDVLLVDLIERVALGLATVLAQGIVFPSAALAEALHHLVEEFELLLDVLHVLERVCGPIEVLDGFR